MRASLWAVAVIAWVVHAGLALLHAAFSVDRNNTDLQLYVAYDERHNDTGECQTDNNSREEQIAFPISRHQ